MKSLTESNITYFKGYHVFVIKSDDLLEIIITDHSPTTKCNVQPRNVKMVQLLTFHSRTQV